MTLDEAVIQMRYAKEHGAVAVCIRPLEGDRLLTNRYFYPIYEEASRLDMAIAIHIANANPANCDLWRTAPGVEGLFASGFQMFRGPTVIACHVLLMSELPCLFPRLRWGFIEASSQWVPWIYHEARSRYQTAGREFPADVFGAYKTTLVIISLTPVRMLADYVWSS
jgi:predicted TIM-barrel fold metal-dependent hydrolase